MRTTESEAAQQLYSLADTLERVQLPQLHPELDVEQEATVVLLTSKETDNSERVSRREKKTLRGMVEEVSAYITDKGKPFNPSRHSYNENKDRFELSAEKNIEEDLGTMHALYPASNNDALRWDEVGNFHVEASRTNRSTQKNGKIIPQHKLLLTYHDEDRALYMHMDFGGNYTLRIDFHAENKEVRDVSYVKHTALARVTQTDAQILSFFLGEYLSQAQRKDSSVVNHHDQFHEVTQEIFDIPLN